ncbi:hypothetical protein IEO70_16450 [Bacillus sp. AGMB 02131]|uniref:Uncharacterized protein n=1 Tax=Peribacillus faecalis TaxID=2772559 RepID=A0A927CZL5_9BACI|nr:hypothetical protein [Peribacillus faecalis]MBD3109931.1 hypothetical protein [Peribacillus faecalis]
MQTVQVAQWLLKVDAEKTREFYKNVKSEEVCDCIYCLNFMEASKSLDPAVLQLFRQLGINPEKPSHLSDIPISEDKMIRYYIGNYHFVGTVIDGQMCTLSDWNETNTVQMHPFKLGISNKTKFGPENFPKPMLQLDFEADIPWLLAEEPEEI